MIFGGKSSGTWALMCSCSLGPVDAVLCREQQDLRTPREEVLYQEYFIW